MSYATICAACISKAAAPSENRVKAAAKLIMTAGMIQPGGDTQRTLSALAEQARAVKAARIATAAK